MHWKLADECRKGMSYLEPIGRPELHLLTPLLNLMMAQVRTVFVDGLPPSWEEDIIKDHLRQFGKIEKVELARNMPAAKRDDFGFITFNTHESAVSCVDGINNSELVFRNKVKVRQRGKSAKYARGGYTV